MSNTLFKILFVLSQPHILDQKILCDPVVLESISYRTRAKRLINNCKTTQGLRKIWTGIACFPDLQNSQNDFLNKITDSVPLVGHLVSVATLPKKILWCSCIRVDLLLHYSKTTDKREQYDWRADKNLDGCVEINLANGLYTRPFF